jgi:hypothetical protein
MDLTSNDWEINEAAITLPASRFTVMTGLCGLAVGGCIDIMVVAILHLFRHVAMYIMKPKVICDMALNQCISRIKIIFKVCKYLLPHFLHINISFVCLRE